MNREDYTDLTIENAFEHGQQAVICYNDRCNPKFECAIKVKKCSRLDNHAKYPTIYLDSVRGSFELFVSSIKDEIFMKFLAGAETACKECNSNI